MRRSRRRLKRQPPNGETGLCLERAPGEAVIAVCRGLTTKIVNISDRPIRIAIVAPAEVLIVREELLGANRDAG